MGWAAIIGCRSCPTTRCGIDPTYRFDTRLQKNFPIREKMSLSLLFEVFNLTNTIQNTAVISAGYTAANKGHAGRSELRDRPMRECDGNHVRAVHTGTRDHFRRVP